MEDREVDSQEETDFWSTSCYISQVIFYNFSESNKTKELNQDQWWSDPGPEVVS